MRCLSLRLFLWLVVLAAPERFALGFDFWVWHRTKPLTPEERAALTAQGTRTLYWHVGEMQNRAGVWKWKAPARLPEDLAEGLRIVPVVRLTSEFRKPFSPEALPGLQSHLQAVAGPAGALQLDYDCPDRLLPEYATALRMLRTKIPHLSITALAHWPRLGGFTNLAREVEEIAPMFYDLQADPTGIGPENPPPALLDPAQFAVILDRWRACPVPWRAGLPTFARLTVFDRTGLSRGQIPNWTWDDFCFHKSLHTVAPTRLGVTLFRAASDARVAGTPVLRDEFVASRFTDRAALARAVTLAREAGAVGVVLFRLPDGGGPGGWSLGDLEKLATDEKPRLILRCAADETLELVNESAIDLAPRLSGPKGDRDRGYALEIDAPAPIFREALAGGFWRVTSHTQPDAEKPVPVPVPLAKRLTFWFSHLPGRATLRTGLLQLAPGASLDILRYRILDCPGSADWKTIAPAVSATATP